LNPLHALLLVLVSVALTMLGGLIPARMAAHKDPVEALRAE
jgi:ABC-type antimicrobial peptide transport system permease subunit